MQVEYEAMKPFLPSGRRTVAFITRPQRSSSTESMTGTEMITDTAEAKRLQEALITMLATVVAMMMTRTILKKRMKCPQ